VVDFLVADRETGEAQPVTSAQRQVPTVWEILSRRGVEVGVIGWWASWPADPVRGYLVSDRLAYQLFGYRTDPTDAAGKTWPPGLYDQLRPWIQSPRDVTWGRVKPYLTGPRTREEEFTESERELLREFRTLVAAGESYLAIALRLQRERPAQFEAVYFEGTDTAGHLFMPYRLPRMPGVDPKRIESFAAMVDRYYETADTYLGRLLEGRDESWTVMVLSDHGFATDTTRPRATDSRIGHGAAADWHRRFGVLVLSGAGIRQGRALEQATIYDVAPTILALFGQPVPRGWPGRPLTEALTDAFLEGHPLRYRADEPLRDRRGEATALDPAAADVVAKLSSLGYVSSNGGDTQAVTALNNTGIALLGQGRYSEAEESFRAALELRPGAPMAGVNLALSLRLQGETAAARERFEQLLNEPAVRRIAANQLAEIRLQAGELEGAEQVARELLELEPNAAEVHNTLGLILEAKGDLSAASSAFRLAADLDPEASMPRNNLGNRQSAEGRLEEAEASYLAAIEADPYFLGAYNNLALVYQQQGQVERAIDLFHRALSRAPDDPVVLNNLAGLYYASGDRDAARRLWKRCIVADPDYASPLNNLAGLLIESGEHAEAERLLTAALRLDPNYTDARLNLALLLRRSGRVSDARDLLVAATRGDEGAAAAWSALGLLELEARRLAPALEALSRALEIEPSRLEALNAIGETYRLVGRRADALAAWRKSLSIDPQQTQVARSLAALE
jgi:Flp pilus assembly protein TadD